MYGALLGDMIGSPYEFDRGNKTKDFPLFSDNSGFTDDSVMTFAVCEALLTWKDGDINELRPILVESMRDWGERFPDAGYGGMFHRWLFKSDPKPYGSYGNGSAMRVSPVGWLYDTIERTREVARATADVTHNHPEGIKGAESVASAIFLARTGKSKQEIRDYITDYFGYDLSRTCDEIRPDYFHQESCQRTVPEAMTAFLEGNDFEDVIRNAVSLGGDCDTLTCIAGSIAEAFYGVPAVLKIKCRMRLDPAMLLPLNMFITSRKPCVNEGLKGLASYHNVFSYMKKRHQSITTGFSYGEPIESYRMDLYAYVNQHPEFRQYGEILERNGFVAQHINLKENLMYHRLDEEFVVSALMAIENGEHFSDGAIVDAYDSGVLINLLRRLKQLVF